MTQLVFAFLLFAGCCAPSAAVSSHVGAALRAPDSSAAIDGLFAQLGREVVCALRQVVAGARSQVADMQGQLARELAASWLRAHHKGLR